MVSCRRTTGRAIRLSTLETCAKLPDRKYAPDTPALCQQAATDSATWTSLGGRKVVSAANAAFRAEEKRAVESDDEQDDDVVRCAVLLS